LCVTAALRGDHASRRATAPARRSSKQFFARDYAPKNPPQRKSADETWVYATPGKRAFVCSRSLRETLLPVVLRARRRRRGIIYQVKKILQKVPPRAVLRRRESAKRANRTPLIRFSSPRLAPRTARRHRFAPCRSTAGAENFRREARANVAALALRCRGAS
jgi:hypothetical protein